MIQRKNYRQINKSTFFLLIAFLLFVNISSQSSCTLPKKINFSIGDYDEYLEQCTLSCKKCSGSIHGCATCHEQIVESNTFVICDSCKNGLYLLQNSTSSEYFPKPLTFCVPDCQLAHQGFVNNHITHKCQSCGENCASCNSLYGCEVCQPAGLSQGWVNKETTISGSSLTFYQCSGKESIHLFKLFIECSTSAWCNDCDSVDDTICNDCVTEFQSTPGDSTSCSSISASEDYDNCTQGFLDGVTAGCTFCHDKYYLTSTDFCSSCKTPNCLTCDSSTPQECLVCEKGYSLALDPITGYQKCFDCNYGGVSSLKLFPDCAACDLTINADGSHVVDQCNSCLNGYIYDDTVLGERYCVSKCPLGYFGQSTFGTRGLTVTSECVCNSLILNLIQTLECSPGCLECIDYGDTYCTRCDVGTYLLITDSSAESYGFCDNKIATQSVTDIYVQPATSSSSYDVSTEDGSSGNPFSDLMDAIAYAQSVCAPKNTVCDININLLSGPHYLFNDYKKTYRQSAVDDSNNMRMVIQPFYCSVNSMTGCVAAGGTVKLYNKIRDQFKIKVGSGLTLLNLEIDSLDSILIDSATDTTCLTTASTCCLITSGVLTDSASTECTTIEKLSSESCHVPFGGYFIKFDISPSTILTSPPALIIQNCVFSNFLYDYNSFIETNDFGGHITFTNSTFERFTSTCGALIRNFKPAFIPTVYDPTFLTDVSKPDEIYNYRTNYLQSEVAQKLATQETHIVTCTSNCYSLTISTSIFTNFNFNMNLDDTPNLVDESLGMRYQGRILNLKSFLGPVSITGSSFIGNTLGYENGCQIFTNSYSFLLSDAKEDNYPVYGDYSTKTSLQIKNLLSIRNQQYDVTIQNNQFIANSAIKGVVYIETQEDSTLGYNPFIEVSGNTFEQNMGYYGTSAIYIRRDTPGLDAQTQDATQIPCGGVLITSNTFLNNFGCQKYGGSLVSVHCYDSLTTSPDDQDNLPHLALTDQTVIDDFMQYDYSQVSTTTYGSNTIDKIEFSSNTFTNNFASKAEGLIDINGILRVFFYNETYKQNGENSYQTIAYLKTNTLYQVDLFSGLFNDGVNDIAVFISDPDTVLSGIDSTLQMQGVISINYCGFISMINLHSEGNFLLDFKESETRGVFFFADVFYGYIEFTNVTFLDYFGYNCQYFLDIAGIPLPTAGKQQNLFYTLQIGFGQRSPMITFDKGNSQLQTFIFDYITVENVYIFMKSNSNTGGVFLSSSQMNYILTFYRQNLISTLQINSLYMSNFQCECDYFQKIFMVVADDVTITNATLQNVNDQIFCQEIIDDPSYITCFPQIFKITLESSSGSVNLLQDSTFTNVVHNFGIFYLFSNVYETTIIISNNTFNDIQSWDYGIFTVDWGEGAIIEINDCQFNNTFINYQGGIFAIRYTDGWNYINSLTISNSVFYNNTPQLPYKWKNSGYVVRIHQFYDLIFNVVDCEFYQYAYVNSIDMLQPASVEMKLSELDYYFYYLAWSAHGSVISITVEQTVEVYSTNNLFHGCVNASHGGVFYVGSGENATFIENGSQYYNNYGHYGGLISCYNCKVVNFLNNPVFTNNIAYEGGVMFLDFDYNICWSTPISISNMIIENVFSISSGGFMTFSGKDWCDLYLTITNTTFTNVGQVDNGKNTYATSYFTKKGGGVFAINTYNLVLTIENSTFDSTFTPGYGGAILVLNYRTYLDIQNNTFKNISSMESGAVFYMKSSYFEGSLSYNTITCDPSILDPGSLINDVIKASDYSYYSEYPHAIVFYVQNEYSWSPVFADHNTISHCYIADANQVHVGGGAYYLGTWVDFVDTNSNYQYISAVEGSVYYCEYCRLDIQQNTFKDIQCFFGCISYVDSPDTYVSLYDSSISFVTAELAGTVFYISGDNDEYLSLYVYNSSIEHTSTYNGQGSAFFSDLYYMNYYIENSFFKNNSAQTMWWANQAGVFHVDSGTDFFVKNSTFITDVNQNIQLDYDWQPNDYFQILFAVDTDYVKFEYCKIYAEDPYNISLIESYLGANEVDYMAGSATFYQTGLVFCQNVYTVRLRYMNVTNNYGFEKGLFYLKDVYEFYERSSYYQYNSAVYGGVFYLENTYMYSYYAKFKYNYASVGGAVYVSGNEDLEFESTVFTGNQALRSGGCFYIASSATEPSEFYTYDNWYYDNYSRSRGGVITLDDPSRECVFEFALFSNSTAKDDFGGIIFVQNARSIDLIENYMYGVYSQEGQAIYSVSSNVRWISIVDNQIECRETYDYDEVLQFTEESRFAQNSSFYIFNAGKVVSENNWIYNCYEAYEGGVLKLISTTFEDLGSKFYNNSALRGGVIKCSSCLMTLEGTQFYQNIAQDGGVIQIDNGGSADIKNSFFRNNYAVNQGGAIDLVTQSFFTIDKTVFSDNVAGIGSVFNVLSSSKTKYLEIKNSQIYYNQADKNTFQFMYASKVLISGCTFLMNKATSASKNIFLASSNVTIENCLFRDSPESWSNNLKAFTAETYGAFVYAIMSSNVTMNNTKFQDGLAKMGGAIYLSGDSNLTVNNSQFTNCKALVSGGAIYAQSFQRFKLLNSVFQKSNALVNGGDIYAQDTNYFIEISNTTIENYLGINSIYFYSIKLDATHLTIKRSSTLTDKVFSKGSSISCTDCYAFKLKDSLIQSSRSELGGAVYLDKTDTYKIAYADAEYYLIENTTFKDCEATVSHGGALYVNNIQKVKISNSKFINNKAVEKGGGFYYECPSPYNCTMLISDNTSFIDNSAQTTGGGYFWEDIEPQTSSSNSQYFSGNTAGFYGDDVGSYAQKLVSLTAAQYQQINERANGYSEESLLRRRALQSSDGYTSNTTGETVDTQRSGGSLPKLYIGLADSYGNVVASSNNAKLTVQIDSSSNKKAGVFQPSLLGTTQVYSQNGMFVLDDIVLTGTPGQEYQIVFVTDGIDTNKPSNQEYLNSLNSTSGDIFFDLDVSLRECEVGEKLTDAGSCDLCPANSSFSLVKMTSSGDCKSCPSTEAICMGGAHIGPQPGYWRKNNATYNFIKCLNKASCKGMIAPDYEPQGSCDEGYKGILCSDCDVGYSLASAFTCTKCPDFVTNIVRLIGIAIAAVILMVFMINSTLKGAKEKRNVTSIFQKIILNHVQLIILTAAFDFNWPAIVADFFKASEPVGEASTQIFSVDCFLNRESFDENGQASQKEFPIRIFYFKMVLFSILPFLLFILSYGVWAVIEIRNPDKTNLKNKAISTVVILLFFVHPNIVNFVFNAFNCIDIDGESRVKNDLQIECYVGQHFFWAMGVALPSMIVWGLGIPLFAFLLLFKERKLLDTFVIREKFGFLFRGYKQRFYYWEIVIMYRKIALIFIQVFLVQYGVITQALSVYLLLIVFMCLNLTKKPFQTVILNQLETLSLITSMLTIFCGLFFIISIEKTDTETGSSQSSAGVILSEPTKMFFFCIILICNLTFFVFWTYKMLEELKSMLIKKMGVVYIWLCLCGNKLKYEDIKKAQQIQEENEILRETYMEMLRNLKQLYSEQALVLNKKVLEKLNMYLNRERVLQAAGFDPEQKEREVEQAQERRKTRVEKNKSIQKQLKNNHYSKVHALLTEEALEAKKQVKTDIAGVGRNARKNNYLEKNDDLLLSIEFKYQNEPLDISLENLQRQETRRTVNSQDFSKRDRKTVKTNPFKVADQRNHKKNYNSLMDSQRVLLNGKKYSSGDIIGGFGSSEGFDRRNTQDIEQMEDMILNEDSIIHKHDQISFMPEEELSKDLSTEEKEKFASLAQEAETKIKKNQKDSKAINIISAGMSKKMEREKHQFIKKDQQKVLQRQGTVNYSKMRTLAKQNFLKEIQKIKEQENSELSLETIDINQSPRQKTDKRKNSIQFDEEGKEDEWRLSEGEQSSSDSDEGLEISNEEERRQLSPSKQQNTNEKNADNEPSFNFM